MDKSTDHPGPPLLVLAQHYRQACDYAREYDLGPPGRRWRYVSEARHVLGYHGPGRYVVLSIPGERLGPRALAQRAGAVDYLRAHGFTSATR
jgi:hypothetical protein